MIDQMALVRCHRTDGEQVPDTRSEVSSTEHSVGYESQPQDAQGDKRNRQHQTPAISGS
jgi:hypothetical protein